MALDIGDKAPDFTLSTDLENQEIKLSNLRGKPVVIFFYPRDNTPGCTKEACDFRDQYAVFKKHGVEVLGISKDSAKSHRKFKEKYQLPYTLLVDADGAVCKAYDILQNKMMFGIISIGIQRTTFLIDEKGIIRAIWRKVKVPGHVEQILNELN